MCVSVYIIYICVHVFAFSVILFCLYFRHYCCCCCRFSVCIRCFVVLSSEIADFRDQFCCHTFLHYASLQHTLGFILSSRADFFSFSTPYDHPSRRMCVESHFRSSMFSVSFFTSYFIVDTWLISSCISVNYPYYLILIRIHTFPP